MLIPSDYKELLKILNKHRVKYLLVGAYAVIYYTEPRYTKDFDIWVEPEAKNAKKVYEALKEFGAPLKGISVEDFLNKNLFYQIGVAPVRVDIIMDISGIEFNLAWRNRKVADFDGVRINIIGINDLIESKKKTRRSIDSVDLESLQQRLKKWSAAERSKESS
jgi:predicted nucleotidyltransferase